MQHPTFEPIRNSVRDYETENCLFLIPLIKDQVNLKEWWDRKWNRTVNENDILRSAYLYICLKRKLSFSLHIVLFVYVYQLDQQSTAESRWWEEWNVPSSVSMLRTIRFVALEAKQYGDLVTFLSIYSWFLIWQICICIFTETVVDYIYKIIIIVLIHLIF